MGKEMKWIVVKVYGNGKYMQKVFPMWFEWLSEAEKITRELNSNEAEVSYGEKWIAMPVIKYDGKV